MNTFPAAVVPPVAMGLPQANPRPAAAPGPPREATLVLPNHRPAADSGNPAPVIAASAAAIAVLMVLLAVLIWRRSGEREPGALAFATLSRRMRLRANERRVVEQLAVAHGRATPAALLLSEHAFREAMERIRPRHAASKRGPADARAAAPPELALQAVLRRVHGGLGSG